MSYFVPDCTSTTSYHLLFGGFSGLRGALAVAFQEVGLRAAPVVADAPDAHPPAPPDAVVARVHCAVVLPSVARS